MSSTRAGVPVVIQALARCFSPDCQLTQCQENNRDYNATFSLTLGAIPYADRVKAAFNKLPKRDQCELLVQFEDQDALYLDATTLAQGLAALQTAMDIAGSDNTVSLQVTVHKHTDSGVCSVYDIEAITAFWCDGALPDALARMVDAQRDVQCVEVMGLAQPFTLGEVVFAPYPAANGRVASHPNRTSRIAQRDTVCHFANAATVHSIPEDFVIQGHCPSMALRTLANQLRRLLALVYLCDFSMFDTHGEIHLRINGYRLYAADIASNQGLTTAIAEDYFAIYQWVYSEGNTIDKVGLARNVISLHVVDDNLLSLAADTLSSIESGFQIYLKDNVKQYIEIKNTLSAFIQQSSDTAGGIVQAFGTHLKHSTWTMYSFFASIFLIRVLSGRAGPLVSNEVLALFALFAVIALGMMAFANWELHTERSRFQAAYSGLKDRYKDLLTASDLNTILADDAQHRRDLRYITHKDIG